MRWLELIVAYGHLARGYAADEVQEARRELAMLLKRHFVMPTASSTVGEVKDMFAAMRFIATLRCGESSWCAKAKPLSILNAESQEVILERLHASQNPESCKKARYLIYHDDRSTSGFGWNAFILFSAFLQAFLEERVLVEAAAVTDRDHHRWHQRWCSDPPFSMKCFFQSWSKCERSDVFSQVIQNGLDHIPDWQNVESAGNGTCTCNEPHVLWRASLRSNEVFFPSIVARGRSWWYAAMVRLLMAPRPWLEEAAEDFLTAHELQGRAFVVAALRRGNKSIEVPFVDVREFTNQLRTFKEHYGIVDVLLQTEDSEELQLLQRWCGFQGLRLHFTANPRSGVDRFSTRFWSKKVNMTEEGRVAVLNLVIGSRAVAVIGSLHSAWMKLQPAFMMAYHWKVVVVIGLASQDYQNFGSFVAAEATAQQLLRPGEVFEPVHWLQGTLLREKDRCLPS